MNKLTNERTKRKLYNRWHKCRVYNKDIYSGRKRNQETVTDKIYWNKHADILMKSSMNSFPD